MTSFNKIIIFVLLFSAAFGQSLSEKPRKPFMNTDDVSFLGTSNRITSILDEAKQFLSDAIIADELREFLATKDRETASIEMSKQVAKRMHARTGDLVKAIEVGLRVGLAV